MKLNDRHVRVKSESYQAPIEGSLTPLHIALFPSISFPHGWMLLVYAYILFSTSFQSFPSSLPP